MENFRAFRGGPVKGAGTLFFGVFIFNPEKSRAVGTEQPFVSGADQEIGAELGDVERYASTTLTDVEKKQRTLRVARSGETRGVEQHAIIEAHEADRDYARSWRDGSDEVIGGEEAYARRDNLQHDAFAGFHRFPGGVLQREFALGGKDFVARFPGESVRNRGHAGAGAGGQRNFFGFAADEFRDGSANAVGPFEMRGVRHVMRIFLPLEGGLHRAMGNLGHGGLPGGIQVGCIFDFEPFLAVIGGGGSGCGGHRVSCLYLTYHDCSGEGTAGATSKLDTP